MFFGLTKMQLENELCSWQSPSVHACALLRWAYKELEPEWASLPEIPSLVRSKAAELWPLSGIEIIRAEESKYDHSVKFVLRLQDSKEIEAVLMPETRRLTLCLSSQVGCLQGCSFCYTAKMGLIRQLDSSEIVGQVVAISRWVKNKPEWLEKCRLSPRQRISNLVFMGMGEPLDNVDAVIQAIRVMSEPLGLNIPRSKIAVSTAGHLDGLKRLHSELPHQPTAFSLHSVDSQRRSQLMPINRRYPLHEVLEYFRQHFARLKGRHFLLIQYTVINGVNSSPEEAQKLIELCDGIPVKINLIPLNEIDPSRFSAPNFEVLSKFRDILQKAGLRVMIRYSKGQDIGAACGQLVTEGARKKSGL